MQDQETNENSGDLLDKEVRIHLQMQRIETKATPQDHPLTMPPHERENFPFLPHATRSGTRQRGISPTIKTEMAIQNQAETHETYAHPWPFPGLNPQSV